MTRDEHRPRFIGLRFTIIVIRNRHRCFEVRFESICTKMHLYEEHLYEEHLYDSKDESPVLVKQRMVSEAMTATEGVYSPCTCTCS